MSSVSLSAYCASLFYTSEDAALSIYIYPIIWHINHTSANLCAPYVPPYLDLSGYSHHGILEHPQSEKNKQTFPGSYSEFPKLFFFFWQARHLKLKHWYSIDILSFLYECNCTLVAGHVYFYKLMQWQINVRLTIGSQSHNKYQKPLNFGYRKCLYQR